MEPELRIDDGGVLITRFGNFYTKETRLPALPVYKLEVTGTYDFKSNKPTLLKRPECSLLEERISKASGVNIEFLSITGFSFLKMGSNFWNSWDGTSAGIHHDQIYAYLREAVNDYTVNEGNSLVVGCGTGEFVEYLQGRGFNSKGIDSDGTNVIKGCEKFRSITHKRLQDLDEESSYDLIVDPGVLSASVIDFKDVSLCLDNVVRALKPQGVFIHVPYTRSFLTSEALIQRGLSVLQRTEPKNLFNFDYPKQFYVADKP